MLTNRGKSTRFLFTPNLVYGTMSIQGVRKCNLSPSQLCLSFFCLICEGLRPLQLRAPCCLTKGRVKATRPKVDGTLLGQMHL
jgi:hypothetical protein